MTEIIISNGSKNSTRRTNSKVRKTKKRTYGSMRKHADAPDVQGLTRHSTALTQAGPHSGELQISPAHGKPDEWDPSNFEPAASKAKKLAPQKTPGKKKKLFLRMKTRDGGDESVTPSSSAQPPHNTEGAELGEDGSSLWRCETREQIDELCANWNSAFLRKCLSKSNVRLLDDQAQRQLEGLFDSKTTSSPIITNIPMMKNAWHYLADELAQLVADDPDTEIAFVTTICGKEATSHIRPTIELWRSHALVQSTLRAMSPHFFGITEAALFNSTSHPAGGQLLQVHNHALVFGPNAIANARKIAKKHMDRFTPNATDAPQIVVRPVKAEPVNIARICAYLFKPPHRCKTWCPPRDGKKGHMHHSEKGDRKTRYLRMAMIRAMLTLKDVSFAGGTGKRIRSQMIETARDKCASDSPSHRRLLHPDAIGAFCMEVAKALNKPSWSLPVIAKQK